MQKSQIGQLLIGGVLLTSAFYIGINYRSAPSSSEMNSVAELANEDLTLKKPLLPKEDPPAAGQAPASSPAAPNLQAPALAKPDAKIPMLENPNIDKALANRERSVEPDFSNLESNLQPIASNRDDSLANSDDRQLAQGDLKPHQDSRRGFKPLIPPAERPTSSSSLITPDLAELNLTPRSSNSVLEQSPETVHRVAKADVSQSASRSLSPIPERGTSAQLGRQKSFQVHVVRPNETLQSIAKRYYQSDEYYLEIYVANQDILESPLKLPVGQSLKIPDLAKQ